VSFEALLDQLDPRPNRRGEEFERICKWFLENAPEYSGQLRRVWLWDEWPERWGPDAGIDLVAETFTGEFWAVQAKAYNPAYRVKKEDVDSFLSESARPTFAYRLLIATTDLIGATARKTLAGQEKPAGLLMRSQLETADVVWPRAVSELAPAPPIRKLLREHQRQAVANVVTGFKKSDRGQAIMACGTGKTLVGLHVAEALGSQRTLVLVPSLSLLEQTLREWTANTEEPFAYLAVCSDETVVERDAVVASTFELGVPVTTDPEQIGIFLGGGDGVRVVFATYQSSPQIAQAHRLGVPAFDLALADEAHRCTGPEAGAFATVLDQEQIPATRRLFMTATPRYFTGRLRREAAESDFEIASMDDETRFGPVFHRLAFGEAISRELLSDYQVVVVGVTDSTYRDYAERGVFVTADGQRVADARTLAGQLGLLRAMQRFDLHRVVTFHSRVRGAAVFSHSLPDVLHWLPAGRRPSGRLWALHVSGTMSAAQRKSRLRRLKEIDEGERGVLANARCLTEGVDVPTLDGVAFIDPRRSQIEIVQAVGRAIRTAEDKTLGTIILPVFIDENEADPEHAVEASEFERVWQVVKALRAHDDRLAEELDELRRATGRRAVPRGRPGKIHIDLPTRIGGAFLRAFDAKLVAESTSSWESWFGLLESYVARERHARVPRLWIEDGFQLGQWVSTQRQEHTRGRILLDRAGRLESLPGWIWNAPQASWDAYFERLGDYVRREGHARVPEGHFEDGARLGDWVVEQRQRYKDGKLREHRIQQLAAMLGWTWDARTGVWDETLERVRWFAAREGTANVPLSYVEDGVKLGNWVATQRRMYRAGALEPDRIERLETLPGWNWNPVDSAWKDNFERLRSFAEREGHVRVPRGHREDDRALSVWMQRQRRQHLAGRLEAEKSKLLETLPGWRWSPYTDNWQDGYERLRGFVERDGHPNVPDTFIDEDGFKLGQWVQRQRRSSRSQTLRRLTPERRALLEALPGWTWDVSEAMWDEGYSRLLKFVEREGHADIPTNYRDSDGFGLGRWVANQRGERQRGRLDEKHRDRLEAVPGWMWNTLTADWERAFQRLSQYLARTGTSAVSASYVEDDGFNLGQWVHTQKRKYRRGTLDPERQRRLEALPGWHWSRPRTARQVQRT
jgi:superfamily II DNA or RNA helicase